MSEEYQGQTQQEFASLQFSALRAEIQDRLERASKLVNILLSSSLVYVVAVFVPLVDFSGPAGANPQLDEFVKSGDVTPLFILYMSLILIVPLLCFALEVMVTSETDAIARAGFFIRDHIEPYKVETHSQGWEGWLNIQDSSFGKRTSEKMARVSRYMVIILYCVLSATIGGFYLSEFLLISSWFAIPWLMTIYFLIAVGFHSFLSQTKTFELVEQHFGVLVLDVDGCLTNSEGEISAANASAIQRLLNLNITIILATGRASFGVWDILEKLNLNGLHAVSNGGSVLNYPKGEVELLSPIPMDVVDSLACSASDQGILWAAFGEDGIFCERGREDELKEVLKARGDIPLDNERVKLIPVSRPCESPDQAKVGRVSKFWCLINQNDADTTRFVEQKRFQGVSGMHTTSETYEFFAEGVNKIDAVRRIVKAYGLEEERVLALGDYDNDLDLLRWADAAYAPLNASPRIRKHLGGIKIRKSNDEDFVAHVIGDLFV